VPPGSGVVVLGSAVVVLGSGVVATGSRVVATGSEVVATGSGVVATGSEVVATGSGVAALGSEVVATGSGVAALGSGVVATGRPDVPPRSAVGPWFRLPCEPAACRSVVRSDLIAEPLSVAGAGELAGLGTVGLEPVPLGGGTETV
jgi:hypothetical protein